MARTSTTANSLLGLLALRPRWSAWELAGQIKRNMRFFWPRAESRILAALRRLDEDGLVSSRNEAVGNRPRTTYVLTSKGRRRLEAWLASTPSGTRLECEPLLRVMLADHSTPDAVLNAIEQIEADAEAILEVGRAVAEEYKAGTAPFQDQVHVRAFVFDFLTQHATGLLAWAERTRAELECWPELSEEQRAERAVTAIAKRAANVPDPPS